jgi:hypothetical protein
VEFKQMFVNLRTGYKGFPSSQDENWSAGGIAVGSGTISMRPTADDVRKQDTWWVQTHTPAGSQIAPNVTLVPLVIVPSCTAMSGLPVTVLRMTFEGAEILNSAALIPCEFGNQYMYIVNAKKPLVDTVHVVWASSVKSPAYVESPCANPELATNRSPMVNNNTFFILATSFNANGS